jgi:plastocyanin
MKKYTFFVFTMTFLVGMFFNTSSFAVTHTVLVGNNYFNPTSLSVEVGDIVKWEWVEGNHTTTSTSVPAGAATWDKPINSGNQTYSYTVTTAGNYNYKCTPHAAMGMVGSFVATAAAPSLTVSPSNQNVTATSGSTSFTVLSNTTWNVTSDQTWCTVTSSGSGNGTITANYTVNSSTSPRVATITVSASGVSNQVVTVTQAGAAATLSVSPPSQSVTESAGSTDFTVTSNSVWEVSSDATWCTVTPAGTGNGTIMAVYEANSSNTERTANITVFVSGVTPVVVTVMQDGSSVGIPQTSANSIRLFPNPAKDVVKISLDNLSPDNTRISLIDLTGKIIFDQPVSGNETSLKVGDLPRGLYFVKISLNNEQVTRRLVLVD